MSLGIVVASWFPPFPRPQAKKKKAEKLGHKCVSTNFAKRITCCGIFCPTNLPELQGHLLGRVRLEDASLTFAISCLSNITPALRGGRVKMQQYILTSLKHHCSWRAKLKHFYTPPSMKYFLCFIFFLRSDMVRRKNVILHFDVLERVFLQ